MSGAGREAPLPPLPVRGGARRRRARGGGGGRGDGDGTPRVLARGQHATVGSAKTDALRSALRDSLEQVQAYTALLKQDIIEARKLCPVTSIRAQLYMQRWGLRKFEATVNRMLHARLLAAWRRWNEVSETFPRTHTHTHAHTCTHTHAHTHAHTYAPTQARARALL